jgi:hypothetical protein
MSTKVNKYQHPHLFKGTSVSVEGKNEVIGEKGRIAECSVAVPWRRFQRIDRVQYPELIFTAEPFNKSIMYVEFDTGLSLYLLDPYDEVLEAWELYLNAVSLGHRNLLSN